MSQGAPKKKSAAEVLREALEAKKAKAGAEGARKLRPDPGAGKESKDAARRAGKSRKVH